MTMASTHSNTSGEHSDTTRSPNVSRASTTSKRKPTPRSRLACLQCRARRTKCGALPPNTCAYCRETGQACQWPSVEHSKRRGRPKQRYFTTGPDQLDISRSSITSFGSSHGNENYERSLPDIRLDMPAEGFAPASDQADFPAGLSLSTTDLPWVNVQTDPMTSTMPHSSSYYRPSGMTALQPSRQHSPTLEDIPSHPLQNNLSWGSPVTPDASTKEELVDLFFTHFGCQFPFLSKPAIKEYISLNNHSSLFTFHAIAAVASRFRNSGGGRNSESPPSQIGQVHWSQALMLSGEHIGTRTRETIITFVLLSLAAYGFDDLPKMKSFSNIAMRMCLEGGLHLRSGEEVDHTQKEANRLDRLLFWSVLIHDSIVCFSEGCVSGLDPDDITQQLPSAFDCQLPSTNSDTSNVDDEMEMEPLHSPFAYLAHTCLLLCRLSNHLNSSPTSKQPIGDLQAFWTNVARQYDDLPLDMNWTAANLQWHYRTGQASIYLSLHFWNYTIQAFRYLVNEPEHTSTSSPIADSSQDASAGFKSIEAGSWQHCARFIGEMLVLSDVIDPHLYLATPLVSHCMYVAECCFVKDLKAACHESEAEISRQPSPSPETASTVIATRRSSERDQEIGPDVDRRNHQSRQLYATIALEHIATFKQGLSKLRSHWQGTRALINKFDRRVASLANLDITGIPRRRTSILSARSLPERKGWLASGSSLPKTARRNPSRSDNAEVQLDLSLEEPSTAIMSQTGLDSYGFSWMGGLQQDPNPTLAATNSMSTFLQDLGIDWSQFQNL